MVPAAPGRAPPGTWAEWAIDAPEGCHTLRIEIAAPAALHAELVTTAGPFPLPLERDGADLAATFHLDAHATLLRLAPVEGDTLSPGRIALEPAAAWHSLLPDWRIGPLALPPRPPGVFPAREDPASLLRPDGWDPRIAVDALEAASLAGTLAETGRAGVMRLRIDPPLAPGRHRVEGWFLTPDGKDARVAPRLLVPGAARDPLDGLRLRPLGDGRYGATLVLSRAADTLLLRPREERGRVVVGRLSVRPASVLAELAGLVAGRVSRPRERAVPPTPIPIPVAPARLTQPVSAPLATIVTPTRDAPHRLRLFLDTIGRGTDLPFEIVLVDNGTTEREALRLLAEADRLTHVRVVADPRPFNFAALVNRGARLASAPVLVLANNDLEFPASEWLAPLVDAALDPRIGVAGARLLYPDGRIQHDGIVLAGEARVEHAGRHSPAGRRPLPPPGTARPVRAVTGALMAIRRDLFESLGGMRADRYPVLCNDVDLSLRAARAGRLAVVVSAAAVHHESSTIGPPVAADVFARGGALWRHGRALEADHLRADWADILDGRPDPAPVPHRESAP